jgi:lysyl-tRNA synthetase class 2
LVAAAGIAMLLLANALHRRSRAAWLIAIALLIVSAAGHVLRGLDLEVAMLETFLAGYLVGTSEHFTAHLDRRRNLGERSLQIIAIAVIAYLFGVVGLLTGTSASLSDSAIGAFALMTGQQPHGIHMPDRVADVLAPSIVALLVIGALIVLYRLLGPSSKSLRNPATATEAFASEDSLAWFATRHDKTTLRRDGAAISYGEFGMVALASGDPLGRVSDWNAAISGFVDETARHGRYAAVIGCGTDAAESYRRFGLRQLYMGDEAVLHFNWFTLQGGAMKTVRNSHTRAVKAGYTAQAFRTRDLSSQLVEKLRRLSTAWRAGADERGFSMALGRLFEPEDDDAVVVVGFDGEGVPRGFLHLVPWMHDGASLDVMRRDRDAIAVLNDFLVAECARLLPQLGIERLSLNFSTLRGLLVAGQEPDAPWNLRLQRWILLRLSSSFQIESLYRFNKKFNPEWVPRYLMVDALEDAPFVLFAALKAEGLLPRLGKK